MVMMALLVRLLLLLLLRLLLLWLLLRPVVRDVFVVIVQAGKPHLAPGTLEVGHDVVVGFPH